MRLVLSEGPTNSPPIAIVGEAPGVEEEKQGRPFVGASGHLLNQMLAQAGIPRGDCYITNVSQVRPPNNDFGAMYYDDPKRTKPKMSLLEARERVWKELSVVKPKIVVPMGTEALRAIGHNYTSINTYRGTVIEHYGLRILPTYHPAYILRVYGDRPVVEADLRKAARQAHSPYHPPTNIRVDPSFEEVLSFLHRRPERLAIDIETLGEFGTPQVHTRCIGFSWTKFDAFVIPLISKNTHHWGQDQELAILTALDKLLQSPDVNFTLQNGPFDTTVIAKELGLQVKNYDRDTMFMHHLLYPELPKDLGFLSSIYTDHPMYWGYNRANDEDTWKYCGMDCLVTFEVQEELRDELKQRGMLEFYQKVVHPTVRALIRVQSRGVLIDTEARDIIATATRKEMDEVLSKIHTTLGFELNPSSPKQVMELVYDKWQLPKQVKPGTRGVTTDEDALKALCRKTTDATKIEILKSIISFRQKRVLLGTFTDMGLDRGRVRTSYNPGGTVTGRLSSSGTYDGFGGNLQNIPRGPFRRIFRADDGKVLIKADLSQAEYRVLIWRARISRVIERLQDPTFSIHYWNASENIYRVPRAEVTKKMYDEAKNGTYAANYGVGPLKVSRMYDMELDKAKFIIERYHEAVPEIQGVYQHEIRELLQTTRCLVNPLGRERIFQGRMDEELYRAGYSHYCQSTVADVINLALVELENGPDWLEVLLQVHDEIVCQVPLESLQEGVERVRSAMAVPLVFPEVSTPLVIPVEIKVGLNWYDVKSVEEFLKERDEV